MSQLALAQDAEISTRHLSFLENGRSQPSREMVLRLARMLSVVARDRNELLRAAGFAPIVSERALEDPALLPARRAVELVLKAHEPFPALAMDRYWRLVAANAAVAPLLTGVDPALMTAPVNLMRLCLHPRGLAPRIVNLREWREHLLERIVQRLAVTADPAIAELLAELRAYPDDHGHPERAPTDLGGVAVSLELESDAGPLTLLSTVTTFGTPLDVTLTELTLEAFLPANESTASALRKLAEHRV